MVMAGAGVLKKQANAYGAIPVCALCDSRLSGLIPLPDLINHAAESRVDDGAELRHFSIRLTLPVSLPGLTGQSSIPGLWLLDRPVNPPIKSGEGDDSTEVGQPDRKMVALISCTARRHAMR